MTYIDQWLGLVLYTSRLVAENINLVIYEQLVPLKLDSSLRVGFANLKNMYIHMIYYIFIMILLNIHSYLHNY